MMIADTLSQELNIKISQAESVIKLIDDGNTIPFIARYRKELTGSLDDEVLRKFDDRLKYLRNLEEKKETVLNSIEEQGKLTDELKQSILDCKTLVELEDLYRPYKPKRRTRATIAKEKGLEELANIILAQEIEVPLEEIAEDYITKDDSVEEELRVNTVEEAIGGAQDIIAEIISDNASFRSLIRELSYEDGELISEAKDKDADSVYDMYYEYSEEVSKIASHRVLAINRGEKEKFLKIKISAPEEDIISYLTRHVLINKGGKPTKPIYNKYTEETLKEAIQDSYKRLIAPAIERELRNQLFEKAEDKSIKLFSKNLEQLLMQAPIINKVVLGWDPAFRTGCKLAVVDEYGKVLDTTVVYPTEPQNKIAETRSTVRDLIFKYDINIIAIGNGTASRESEAIVADIIKDLDVQYVIVNEAGASVYSASELATEEFPDYNVGERSAISIARRLQDPLAELVKIDPKSIGVGQYQHDMNQKKLGESLDNVVEKSVNNVGVDVNTASVSLMEHVAGISKTVAKNIVSYREENGKFYTRDELLNVKKLGPKAFEQCAGFMKVKGPNPLDNTTVHPESYGATIAFLSFLGYSIEDLENKKIKESDLDLTDKQFEDMAQELGIGSITLKDIAKELKKPGRDPRDEMPQPILRKDVLTMEDLEKGMVLSGTVRNIVDFGIFVDIGVHQDGMVHKSEITDSQYVNHPMDFVSVGDIIDVKVLDVDIPKRRIQLSMII
ncbi:RNA-binding S1 domain-containing protein [Methanobrevibacter ruminantium M1]|uniref:RNA-binding S1 domain-containing protein n=2 Tax=Methanobrevibacter ruminantium TaxID=83816 RepID=D3E1E4_METRM|nr:Tex family protein [Methanobrevibacter ruminantium]ADC48029.1 RNA-binding S1 domain-containing protein [Methanobrevibacter ruminantium M1]